MSAHDRLLDYFLDVVWPGILEDNGESFRSPTPDDFFDWIQQQPRKETNKDEQNIIRHS